MAETAFTTRHLPPAERAAAWSAAIAASYFPLDLAYRDAERFTGALARWPLGEVLVSRLRSDALSYRRRPEHLRGAGEEEFLLTIPRAASLRFEQMGREVVCRPGGFILERGNEPYEFSYEAESDLIVVKIAMRTLSARLPDPGRYCALGFDGRAGLGGLLVDLVRATQSRSGGLSPAAADLVGRQIVDLLAHAVEGDARALESRATSVQRAHLVRVGDFIARHHENSDLAPGDVAAGCGISLRYLHALCCLDGPPVRERIRECRLQAARAALIRPGEARSITEIAYAFGFREAAQFSRAYRARFEEAPRDTRRAARAPLRPSSSAASAAPGTARGNSRGRPSSPA